ncbi:4-hydroxythreonine-4-phosphate dehydrogenase PdxA [Limisphaera sp. VF-2]|jgi:4-hydroxythreonine-4-phosphate dehydrogenase|uniref:4-hydroxythreonine-4-phosphate dehydrogenase PdxA n=1 Tax=Limisphaera sp. VF-2 TaxID=3400418 RepID=UPI0017633AB4
MPLRIGITLGDVTGIGPEVTAKALARLLQHPSELPAPVEFVVFGDPGHWVPWARHVGLTTDRVHARAGSPAEPAIRVLNPLSEPLPDRLSSGDAQAARAAVAWLEAAGLACLRGELDAIVTAPVNKEAIQRAGIPFVGQTEFLAALAQEPEPVMMLLGPDARGRWLRVALATVHIALKEVPQRLTGARVLRTIACAVEACRMLRLPRARVAVCGLNPHCGEGGAFGDEEQRIIAPAVARAHARGWDVVGPLSGDTVFYHALQGRFDAVVAMYHDQGLAPLKAVAFETGVNWSLGLPFIRTSPDHGTAYDIAGQGKADPTSMEAALRLALQLAAHRAEAAG